MKIEIEMGKKTQGTQKNSRLKLNKFMFIFWLLLSFILFEFNNGIAFLFNLSTLFAPLPFAVIAMATSCPFAILLSFIASLAIALTDGFTAALTYFGIIQYAIFFFVLSNLLVFLELDSNILHLEHILYNISYYVIYKIHVIS